MLHPLIRGSDVRIGGVVVGAEMRAAKPALSGVDEPWKERSARGVEDDLWRFDHHLEHERSLLEIEPTFELSECGHEEVHLLGDGDFRHRDHPALGNAADRKSVV